MAGHYDYVIVGSGAAGSVVAARLAESGKFSVCVVEAGGSDRRPFVTIPAGFVKNLHNAKIMWQFCLLYTSPSPRDATLSRMPSSA